MPPFEGSVVGPATRRGTAGGMVKRSLAMLASRVHPLSHSSLKETDIYSWEAVEDAADIMRDIG